VREIRVRDQPFSEIFYEIGDNPLADFTAGSVFAGGRNFIVPARDVLHLKLATPRHPLVGETWLASLAVELGQRAAINQSVTTAAATGRPTGLLTTDLTLTAAQVDELRQRWQAQSSTMAQGGAPILTSGLKFQPVSLSAEDAKIIDQLKLNDRAVAAVFGVPPMLVGLTDAGSPKSAEALISEWLASGLGFLIDHIERAFDQFFGLDVVPAGREWTEFSTAALLRSLFKERIDGLVRGVQGGIFSPNEARRIEGYPAVEAGDEPRLQQQVVPLSWVEQPPAPPPAADFPPVATPPADQDEDDGDGDQDADARAFVFVQIDRRIAELKRAAGHQAAA
jgi:phage portal protein BeeE